MSEYYWQPQGLAKTAKHEKITDIDQANSIIKALKEHIDSYNTKIESYRKALYEMENELQKAIHLESAHKTLAGYLKACGINPKLLKKNPDLVQQFVILLTTKVEPLPDELVE